MTKRTTIYIDSKLLHALKMKSIQTHRSVSKLVIEAICLSLNENALDLQAIKNRVGEPVRSYDKVLKDLKMGKKNWRKKERGWQRFHEWKKGQTDYGDHQRNLRMVGNSADFFLRRHLKYSRKKDVSGIRIMQERLSKIS